ncbi:MAG: hypothetical protein JO307_31595, partial [Bryobacterales bacterium]|nr:hypothetical protein [Bryobacterales bacterium]
MKSRVPNSLQAYTPPIRRRRGPVVSGLYTQPKNPNRIKLPQVRKLMNKACVVMPWIRGEHLPTLRKWCEMELIRLAAFSAITQDGILSVDRKTKDIGARRLVDDYRKLAMSQMVIERELLMTPASRAQLREGEQPLD